MLMIVRGLADTEKAKVVASVLHVLYFVTRVIYCHDTQNISTSSRSMNHWYVKFVRGCIIGQLTNTDSLISKIFEGTITFGI